MILSCFSFFAFHSLSTWMHHTGKSHVTPKTSQLTNTTYEFDQLGLHEVSNIKRGDSIRVKFNQRSLRLFIFFSSISEVYLKNLYIDGSDLLSRNNDKENQVAFAVDADQEAVFNFESYGREHHNHFNHSIHKHLHNHIFNRKSKRSLKEKVFHMVSKFNIHRKSYEYDYNYDYDYDFDFDFNHLNAVLWLLPRDVCGKSSIFEFGGGNANLSVEPTESIITSKTNDEITYSNCIFSPLFDIFNSKSAYHVSVGVRPTESDNYYPSSYKSSTVNVYTDNINNPDFTVNGHQTIQNVTFTKPFFSRYEITQKLHQGQLSSPLTVETFLKRTTTQTDGFDYRKFDLFCLSGSVKACDSKSCFHDDQIELKINMKCGDDFLWQIFAILAGAAVLIIIVIIVIICLCCVGCCACCGLCFFCFRKNDRNDRSPISIDQQNRHSRHHIRNEGNDLEVPLVSLDGGNGQYHQAAVLPVQPVAAVPVYGNQIGNSNAVLVQQNGYQVPVQIQLIPV